MNVLDGTRKVLRWIADREPRTLLVAGWIVFVLGSYPGYLTIDSTLRLYTVRSGEWTDDATLMTALWSLLEYVAAGPFPMLVLQSVLFLVGLQRILRTLISPVAASLAAAGVLLFPPVFAEMAVIQPEALMAGCLLSGIAAVLDERRNAKIAGGVLFVIACSCRPEIVFALVPIGLLVATRWSGWRRVAIALGLVFAVAGISRLADHVLTSTETYAWQQRLMMPDVVGTLRRAKATDVQIRDTLAGLPVSDPTTLHARVTTGGRGALRWWTLVSGESKIFDPITTGDQASALVDAWHGSIASHPGAYVSYRWAITSAILGISSGTKPYDKFGDPQLMAPLHHRATASDWQYGMQQLVRGVAATPLFRPWLYLVLAIPALFLSRRRRVLQVLLASGLVHEVAMFVFAAAPESRYSHWLVVASCVALAVAGVERILKRAAAAQEARSDRPPRAGSPARA